MIKLKKLIVDNYTVLTDKVSLSKPLRILNLADLHIDDKDYSTDLASSVLKLLEDYLENDNNIDVILVSGDVINGASLYQNSEVYRKLQYLTDTLSKKAPVILSLGNHDLVTLGSFLKACFKIKEKDLPEEVKKARLMFKSLGDKDNVYPLDNEEVEVNGIVYTGITQTLPSMTEINYGKHCNRLFVEDFEQAKIKFDHNKINIVAGHAPDQISSAYVRRELDFSDVLAIFTGHLHDGYLSNDFVQKYKSLIKSYGIWETPTTAFVNKMCRGAFIIDKEFKSPAYIPDELYNAIVEMLGEEHQKSTALFVNRGFIQGIRNPKFNSILLKAVIKNPPSEKSFGCQR